METHGNKYLLKKFIIVYHTKNLTESSTRIELVDLSTFHQDPKESNFLCLLARSSTKKPYPVSDVWSNRTIVRRFRVCFPTIGITRQNSERPVRESDSIHLFCRQLPIHLDYWSKASDSSDRALIRRCLWLGRPNAMSFQAFPGSALHSRACGTPSA